MKRAAMAMLSAFRWQEGRDSVVAHNWAPGVMECVVIGHAHRSVVIELLAWEERLLSQHPEGLWIFHDWAEVTSFEPGIRELFVAWDKAHAEQLFRSELLFRSRLVAMSVSVASIVLPKVSVIKDRRDLETRLEEAIRQRSAT